jgi:hypothetical protein
MTGSPLRFAPLLAFTHLALVACLAGVADAGSSEARIVYLGNSITQHGPDPSIDWKANWGMAASLPELDYASQVTAALRHAIGGPVTADIRSDFAFEHDFLRLSISEVETLLEPIPRARFVILQLGDNVDLSGGRSDGELFGRQYAILLSGLAAHFGPKVTLLCVGKWWPAPAVDAEIEARCTSAGGSYVRISDIYSEPWGRAATERQFAASGIGEHPGDRAMHEIARRVSAALAARVKGR